MSFRFWPRKNSVADVWIGDYVADDFLESDILRLYRTGEGGSCLNSHSYKFFDFVGYFLCRFVENNHYNDRGKIISAQVSAFFRGVVRMGLNFFHC